MGEERISLGRGKRCGFAFAGDLIIAPGRALAGGGFGFIFPLRFHERITLQPSQRRIDGAAGQTGNLHDIEAKAVSEAKRLQDERGAMRETRIDWAGHVVYRYVVCYHFSAGSSLLHRGVHA